MFDIVVEIVHNFASYFDEIWSFLSMIIFLEFPHGKIIALVSNVINASTSTYRANIGKTPLYWVHSLMTVIFGGFGGGFIAPILIAQPALALTNDTIVPLCIIFWYLTHYLGLYRVLDFLPVKIVWTVLLGLFRTHSIRNMVITANAVIKPGPYYPSVALVGPILASTVMGCGAMFIPFDKGLGAIKNSLPWPIQAAFGFSVFYHLTVNDSGPLGSGIRSIVGDLSERTVVSIIATLQISTLLLQLLFDSQANLFTPFHKFFYLVFQVQGPLSDENKPASDFVGWNLTARYKLASFLSIFRFLVVIIAIAAHVYFSIPPVSLLAIDSVRYTSDKNGFLPYTPPISVARNKGLEVGKFMGVCQWLSSVQSCDSYIMRVEISSRSTPGTCLDEGVCEFDDNEKELRLVVYKTTQSAFLTNPQAYPIHWSLPLGLSNDIKVDNTGNYFLLVDDAVGMKIVSYSSAPEHEPKVIWSQQDKDFCSDGKVKKLSLHSYSGIPSIQCTGSEYLLQIE